MKLTKKQKKEMKEIKNNFFKFFNIWFADAKSTWERIICIFSALFWISVEIFFLRFFLTFAFGLVAYISTDSYSYTWETLIINSGLINNLVIILVLIITIFRIPLFKVGKTIKEK